jgi:hypothetical protein
VFISSEAGEGTTEEATATEAIASRGIVMTPVSGGIVNVESATRSVIEGCTRLMPTALLFAQTPLKKRKKDRPVSRSVAFRQREKTNLYHYGI